jgi:hypothetical protein
MISPHRSGIYTDGKKIFELSVGVSISIRIADGTRRYYPPDLTIYTRDWIDREARGGIGILKYAEMYPDCFINDSERCEKIIKKCIYIGEL